MTAPRFAASLAVLATGIGLGFLTKPEAAEFAPAPAHGHPSANDKALPGSSPDLITTTLASLLHRGDFRQLAQMSALAGKLDSPSMADLLNRLERLRSDDADRLLARLMSDWTRRDLQAANAWIRPRLDQIGARPWFGISGDADSNLVNAWIAQTPESALEYARDHPGTPLADMMLSNAVQDLRGKSGEEKFALLLSFPESHGRDRALRQLINSWMQRDQAAAFTGVLNLPPGEIRDRVIGEVLSSWAQRKPAEAFAHFDPSAITDPTIPLLLVSSGAKRDPAEVLRWLEKQNPETMAQCRGILVSQWAEKDPVAAFNWALAHGVSLTDGPISPSQSQSLGKWTPPFIDINSNPPFSNAIQEQTRETLAWLKSVPAGPERNALLEMAFRYAGNQPEVRELIAELPPDSAAEAMKTCVQRMYEDPAGMEALAAKIPVGPARDAAWYAVGARLTEPLPLPSGRDRDALLNGMAAMSSLKPERSWEFLRQIGDPQLRQQAWDDIACRLSGSNTATFLRTWLDLPDLPEDWKRPWRSE